MTFLTRFPRTIRTLRGELGQGVESPAGFDSRRTNDVVNTTRVSLLLRIQDSADGTAWQHFVDIYGPLIYRYATRKGLQDADAADLTQDVMREISKSIQHFRYDPTVGKFRNWLYAVARHTLSGWHRRVKRQPIGSGDSGVHAALHEVECRQDMDLWDQDYRDHLFQWASDKIRNEFHAKTWNAFWKTAVDGRKPAEVAEELGMSVGAVYVAKNRVMVRLRKTIASLDDSWDCS